MIGKRLGPYQVLHKLGEGGMGEVYRARDTRLGRDVAIKVLPPSFASDPDRLARFEREARVLASLNHPNIATLHGIEDVDSALVSGQVGVRALVMELVDGETLAERIRGAGLSVAVALNIARQIAEALEAAHEKGVVHRDLKPANIKVTPNGTVKVLDFGLAKVTSTEVAPADPTQASTIMAGTRDGLILGTVAYMSPEQARGQAVDKRTDIWAFGCVLFEMLTSHSAFGGATVSDTIAAILERQPEWSWLPATMPVPMRRLLTRCLDKDLRRRLQDVGDARIEIEDVLRGDTAQDPATAARASTHNRWLWPVAVVAVAGLAALAAVTSLWIGQRRPAAAAAETRLDITTPPTMSPTSFAVSPDGLSIVFAGTSQGQSSLWLRALNAEAARPLAGTNNGVYPFWSPDGRSIGFFADGKLKRVDIAGGAPQALANATLGAGGIWTVDGAILFAPSPVSALMRVSAAGGTPSLLLRMGTQHIGHSVSQILPDGIHFLYFVTGSPEVRGVYIGGLDGSTTPRLLDVDVAAVYASSGYVLFVREATLFAQPLDLTRLALGGEPLQIADGVAVENVGGQAPRMAVSTSAAGPIVYRRSSGESRRQLAWIDRSGREITRVGPPIFTPTPDDRLGGSLSPDGRFVALTRTVSGNGDVWLLDSQRGGVLRRFTDNPDFDGEPHWSSDGNHLAINSVRDGSPGMYQTSVGGGPAEPLLTLRDTVAEELGRGGAPSSAWLNIFINDWSSDGRFLLFNVIGSTTLSDLWGLPLGTREKPFPVVQTTHEELRATFAPNGRWIAYHSNESGRFEVYVRRFRGADGLPQLISTEGGTHPRWRRDGKELFYVGSDHRLMAVAIGMIGDAIEPGVPAPLFATSMGQLWYLAPEYMVSADGQRFLIDMPVEQPSSPMTVILNWSPTVR